MTIAGTEACRIADEFLKGQSIERRKALATEITMLINRCEQEFAAEVIRRIKAAEQEPGLTPSEMKAQAQRCGCRGSDDLCSCQNVPDATTKTERKIARETRTLS